MIQLRNNSKDEVSLYMCLIYMGTLWIPSLTFIVGQVMDVGEPILEVMQSTKK